MTPSLTEIRDCLIRNFPPNTKSWAHATCEVRDICRWARQILGLGEEYALDFHLIESPSEWNTKGIRRTLVFYRAMDEDQRQEWVDKVNESFENIDGTRLFHEYWEPENG